MHSKKLNKETITNKVFEMQVVVSLPTGRQIVLEMQNIYDLEAELKNVMYVCGEFYRSIKF